VSYGANSDEKDFPIVIAEDYSTTCWPRISFGGPVEVEFDEVLRGGTRRWGYSERGAVEKEH